LSVEHICVIEPVLTRYRMPVYLELSQHCRVDWIFSSSSAASGFGGVERVQASSLRYVEIPACKPFGGRFGMVQWGLLEYLIRESPDAILASADLKSFSFWTTLLLAKWRRIPFHAHGYTCFKRARLGLLRKALLRLILRQVTSFIAYAPIVRDSFAARGLPTDRVSVAHNSLLNPFPVGPEEKSGRERGILFIGRLRQGSGLRLLLRVSKRLREKEGHLITLHVIGTGEDSEQLRQQAANCSWVVWHGAADDLQVSRISRDCFLGCYPGNAGLSVVHLMSLSLPVVVHNDLQSHQGPEPSFVRDEVSGVLFDQKDAEDSLYRTLRALAMEPSRVARMQRAAFEDYQSLVNPSLAERLWAILSREEAASAT
jgi:glycosyltransferase involved in cell wall biosynthesis